ncbi:NAD(P)/FAD-dependent oxidoreductase [Ornithinimicrobium cavernae]|uniref:NAD(P)/FAD-dependent oxidoreductase n=1 Tax=Ornithinimicrobium cavernae TaxID=2666047 RepID=UPI000D69D50E|nr:FAD-binding oxidoreductase [Ornithinimicrobium cavernae]
MQIVVIGAGVVGASIATRLAQRGAVVTLVDQGLPGTGTSSTSFAWINANGKEPESYYALNLAGLRAHHGLGGNEEWLRPGGHVEIAVDEAHVRHLRGRMERLVARGYAVEEIGADRARELLPDVVVPDQADTIAYFPQEAYCFPLLYLARMLAEGRAAGVTLRDNTGVVALDPDGDGARVTLSDGTVLRADAVVSAVGRRTSELAALAGATVPMAGFTEPGDVTVGYLLRTIPLPVRLSRVLTTPWLNVRPDGGGRLLLQALDLDATADPAAVPAPDSPLVEDYLERLRAVVPNAGSARIAEVVVGQRVIPADGLTVAGRLPEIPWLYAVATHSGVTLAPLLGAAVAGELFGEEEPLLADFRPDRFAEGAQIVAPSSPRKPGEQ